MGFSSQHPPMHAKDLFEGRKAHVGGHPGHNFSLPRVLKKLRRGEAGVLKPRFLKY